MIGQIGLAGELSALRELIRSHWVNASVFPDDDMDAADGLEQVLRLVSPKG